MERYFRTDMPFLRFARNTLAVSLIGLVPVLLLYVALQPRFAAMLLDGGLALRLFLRQVLTNGLVVVFLVNYLGFTLYAVAVARQGKDGVSALILLIDLPARVVVFVVLHGLIYFFSADWFGSFGGDHWLALRVVGPTLARSALFENLSGVYLYATLVGALPVYAEVVDGSLARAGADRWWLRPLRALPRGWAAALLALGLFAVFVLLLTAVAAGIADLEPL